MSKFLTIYERIKAIPKGCVLSYGEIARSIPECNVRTVVFALHASSEEIPWHRVINSKRKISFKLGSQEYLLQKKLLEAEGVRFNKNQEVDFRYFYKL